MILNAAVSVSINTYYCNLGNVSENEVAVK